MQEHEAPQESAEAADAPADTDDASQAAPIEFTGQAAVDAVLASLESLDDLPVAEHVEVFDRAHEGLRRSLDEAGRDPEPGED